MSKVNLIRKTELQLLDNINNFNNILSYISNNSSGKLSEIVNLVKNIAKEEGVSVAELASIAGTGKEGRVTKNDILEYVKE